MREETIVDVLAAEVRDQLVAQTRRFDRLDTRAGVLLGFAGVFVALSSQTFGFWIVAGRLASVVSAVFALGSFLVSDFPAVDLIRLRKKHLSGKDSLTRLTLLDTHIAMLETARRLTDRKARRVKVTIGGLSIAIVLAIVGLLVENPR